MNPTATRTPGHQFGVTFLERVLRRGGGGVIALVLSLGACGRGTDPAAGNVTKVEGAVVTGTTPVLTISPGATNFTAQGAAIVVDPNLTLTISDGSDLPGVQVSISTGFVSGQDVLAFTPQAGVTGSWSAATGVLTLSGTVSVASYQTVLRSVTYNNTAGAAPNTQARVVTFSIGAGSLSFGGHYYEFVSTGLNWTNARAAAELKTYYGLKGYLATITSAAENTFLNSKFTSTGWIGASDAAVEGQWRWVTGPDTGTLFWLNGTTQTYSSWAGGEPNNAGGENYAQFYVGGLWNDLNGSQGLAYVVEYGGTAGDPSPQVSGPKSLTVSSLPNYTITASAGANGTISPTGVNSFQQGQSQAFTITPNANYTVAGVLVDGASVGAVTTYTFTNVTANHTIAVTFAAPVIAVSAGNNQNAATGAAFAIGLAVLVTDSGGAPLSGRSVVFAAPGAGASATLGAPTTTNASGIASVTATANATAGSYTVTATVSGTSASTNFTLRNLGAPSTITVVTGGSQVAVVQGDFGMPLVAVVRDSTAFALPNITVTFAAPAAGGASAGLSATSVTTNASGLASITATANTIAGSYNVTASAPAVSARATFALTNLAGAAATITLTSGGVQTATVGAAFGSPIVARVTDAFGNPVLGATVTFAAPASGASGTLGMPTPTTNALGLAQTIVAANTAAGSYTVSASIALGGSGTASASATLTNTAGPPAMLTITAGGGQIALTGAAFASPLSVRVVDGSGNPVVAAAVAFTATASPGTGASATLSSATVATNSSGLATVLATANASAGTYTVAASVAGAPAVSFGLTNQLPLALSPAEAAVAPRGSVTFVATGGSGTGYVFAVQTAPSGGDINASTGVYTAGAVALVSDIITVTDSQSHIATATISVGAALALASNLGKVPPRGGAVFTTTGGSKTGLTFTIVANHSSGTIDANGNYVAGENDNETDIVLVTDSLGNSATATIDVGPGVTLAASATNTPPRGALSFAASGGSANFTYGLGANPSGATIDSASGAYVAGSVFHVIDVVTATDDLGNTASVNIAVGDGVSVNPDSPSIPPLGTITLSASGGSGTGYRFALGGSASGVIANPASGVYMAGATGNTSDLVTVTDSLGNTGTTSVSVGGGIHVSPSSLTTPPRGSQAFSASGGSGLGYAFTLPSHASGGMITAGGGYTAGATGSTMDELSVVDSLGNQATVAITVGKGVAVAPTAVTLAPLGQQTITVLGGSGNGYTFVLSSNHSGGAIDSLTGEYTAGATGAEVDVVTARDDLGNTATATITVTAALTVTADTLSAAPRASLAVNVTGGAPGYAFSISGNGSGGSIDPSSGAYTAGAKPDSTDVISIEDRNGAITNVIVNVGPGVGIVPDQPSVPPRGTVAFGGVNGSGTGYVFTLEDNKSGGSIVALTGAYTAGPTGDVADLVTVTDSLGNTNSVSVAVGGRLVLGPANPFVAPRESLALVAVAGSGAGYVFAFETNASQGTVNATTGAYVAGAVPNAADVLTLTDSLGNTAITTINVGPGLTVVPDSASTAPHGTISLKSRAGSGTGYRFALITNASMGSVSASGVYNAGAVGDAVDVVTVTDSLGNTDTVTINVGRGLIVTAAARLVPPRGTTTFTAVGGVGGGYTFTVRSNGSGGNIVSTTGVYTAGDAANSTDVIEVSDPFGSRTTLTIMVGPGITITPAALSAPPRGTLALVAAGGSGNGYRYKFTANASGGTLDGATGMYTAGSTTDVLDAIEVSDSLGNAASATIAVGGALTVNAALPMVAPHEGVLLTAAGGSGKGFSFALTTNASGGTVDPTTGQYTAGTIGNVGDIVTVTDSLGNTAHVTVAVGDGLHVAPSTVAAAPLAQLTFTASGGSGEGYGFTLAGNDSHGAIDPVTGAYTAGALGGGTDIVTVTDSLGNTATVDIHVSAALSAVAAILTSPPHGTLAITVTGGAPMLSYTLTTNASGGSINPATGAYTAGSQGSTTDLVTVRDANNATVTITVRIGPGLSVAAVTGSVRTGQTMLLSATGGSGSGLRWTIASAGSGGTVDPTTGAYTAGPHAGTDVVRVVDSLGNTAELSIPVTLASASHAANIRGGAGACTVAEPGAGSGCAGGHIAGFVLAVFGLLLANRRRRRRGSAGPSGPGRSGGPRWVRRLWSILIVGGVLGLVTSSPARAQSAGFALDQFNPSQRGSEWFVLDSLDIHGNLRPAVGVSSSWSYRPLVLTSPDGSYRMSVMTNQEITHVGGSVVMWSRVRFGVDIPVQIFGDGNNTTIDGVTYMGPASSSSLGDIRLNATLRVFGDRGGPLTGAVALTGFLPSGDTASYAGDSGAGVAPSALLAGQSGLIVYAAQVGGTVRRRTAFADTSVGSDLFLSAAAGVRLARERLLIGPELFGRSVLVGGAFLDARATPIEAMLGAHYTILADWRASAGIATGLSGGIGNPTLRGLLAFEWAPGVRSSDRDNDGIVDATDACPDTPGLAASDVKANGCPAAPPPAAPLDRDGDGIADATDACPEVAGVAASDAKANGCPPPPPDRDGDTIADNDDACPDVAGVAASDAKANGCPPDRDRDGIADAIDACPEVAGIASAEPATNGCPDPDRDHDGVANTEDACPDDAGPSSPDAKRNGCPKAFVAAGQIKILDQVKFRTNSATISSRGPGNQASEETLMAVRQILIDNVDVKNVLVEGHTDSVGSAADNRRLSAGRASAVVKWLVVHGIAAERLSSAGVGSDNPIDANDTATGRRNNRRVEFHILPPEDGHVSAQ